MTENQKRHADQYLAPLIDRYRSRQSISRRQFLVGAAAGVVAFAATNEVLGAPPVYVKATLEDYGGKTVVVCKGKGKTCAILRLVNAKRISPFHDEDLEACTVGINAILDGVMAKNTIASRHPCFIVTPYAPFMAWSQTAPGRASERTLTLESDPAKFYQGLGISVEAFKPKPTRFWYWIGGGVGCKKGGDTQIVGRLLTADKPSAIHDAALAEATLRINSQLDTCEKSNRNPRRNLSMLVTPKGLFLAWSEDDDREGPLPRGAVTALDDDDKVARALGIEAG